MKKILIASTCALTLCFTSCASKEVPETDSQIQAPQPEQTKEAEEKSETLFEENTEISKTDEAETSPAEETSSEENNLEEIKSEAFPEPGVIEEPEIITLEPLEEPEPSENEEEAAAEEIEKEEVPEITIINDDKENESNEFAQVNETTQIESDDQSENSTDEITANDVVVVTNQDSDDISGGIDITNDEAASEISLSELEKDITPSRSVTLKKFEYLDVTYPGTGWIFMGLTDNSKDLAYFGRKLGTKDTKFSLQARAAGTKIIHFYRNDPLTGKYLDDYIEVIISSENGSNKTHIEAPEYKLPVQKKESPSNTKQDDTEASPAAEEKSEDAEKTDKSTTKTSAPAAKTNSKSASSAAATVSTPSDSTSSETSVTTVTSETSEVSTPVTQTSDSSTLLKEAQLLYNEKEYKAALNKLNQFFEYSTDKGDEALYLKGQILEAKSDVRDIKGAIDAYTTLTKNYPASKLWDSANKRIIYLKRFYLEVR